MAFVIVVENGTDRFGASAPTASEALAAVESLNREGYDVLVILDQLLREVTVTTLQQAAERERRDQRA